jgi:predicted RNase H-like nuclease
MTLAGIDGCKNGWVVIWERDETISMEFVEHLHDILDRKPKIAVIDIPIGLLEIGTREADRKARQILKSRSCCVFTAPIRPLLQCATYDLARQCRHQLEGKSVTRQAWAILDKVKGTDKSVTPLLQQTIKEGHPEISFAFMNGGTPLSDSKHSSAGQQARIRFLSQTVYVFDIQYKNRRQG